MHKIGKKSPLLGPPISQNVGSIKYIYTMKYHTIWTNFNMENPKENPVIKLRL